MKERIHSLDFIQLIQEEIAKDKQVAFTPKGPSMLPTFISNQDVVYLTKPTSLKKYDICLYIVNNRCVLHRIIKVNKDNTFTMCGDNNIVLEKNIAKECILAKVIRYEHQGKQIDCQKRSFYLKAFFLTKGRIFKKIARRCKHHE